MKENNSRNKAIIIGAGILLVFLAVFLYNKNDYSWVETFKEESEEPYGTHIFKSLLENSVADSSFVVLYDTIPELDSDRSFYVFIGSYAYLDSVEIEKLGDYILAGNTALISSKIYNGDLLEQLEKRTNPELVEDLLTDSLQIILEEIDEAIPLPLEYDDDYADSENDDYYKDPDSFWELIESQYRDSTVKVSFSDKGDSLPIYLDYVYDNEKYTSKWNHFGREENIELKEYMKLRGKLNDEYVNFIEYDFGDGRLLIHSTPRLFTNYSLLERDHFKHVESMISDIEYDHIYWDEVSRTKSEMSYQDFQRNYNPDEGPLNFILSQKSLRWAWYLLLFGILLYVVFGARRKQRIIPVIKKLPNTSIQFAEALSQLYRRKKDHRRLALLKWNLFLNHLRGHYALNTQMADDEAKQKLIQKLSLKSGLEINRIKELFNLHKKITIIYEVDDKLFIDFHQKLEDFYRDSK